MSIQAMPVMPKMNWVPTRKSWRRRWLGKPYEVSCRALACPPTKEASCQAANSWWTEQERLYYAARGTPLERAQQAVYWASKSGLRPEHMAEYVLPLLPDLGLPEETTRLLATSLVSLKQYREMYGDDCPVTVPGGSQKLDFKVESAVAEFVTSLENRHKNGKLSAQSVENYRQAIGTFAEYIGNEHAVKSINEETVKAYHAYLTNLDFRLKTKGQRWQIFKMAVGQWVSNGYLAKPRNLDDRTWAFGSDEVEKDLWPVSLFQDEYSKADGFGRLVLLLVANCGFYASDMAHLDYQGGSTITRYRTKTKKQGAKVTFHLWPETQAHLAEYGHMLEGTWGKELVNGKVRKTDKIGDYAKRFAKNIKWLRHTSDQFLEDRMEYRQYKDYFLGHAASKLSEIHYTNPVTPAEMFAYLHDCYFGK